MDGIAVSSMYKTKFSLHHAEYKSSIFTCLRNPRSQAHSTKFNPTFQQTQSPFSHRSTSGHMLWFWLTSDGHYSFYDGNNNFNAVLMIVIIMLGTHSPNSVLREPCDNLSGEWVSWLQRCDLPHSGVQGIAAQVGGCHFLGELLPFDPFVQY